MKGWPFLPVGASRGRSYSFLERVWEAMDEWNQSLLHLLPSLSVP